MSNEYKDWLQDLTEEQKANRELCLKYPFIVPRAWKTGEPYPDWQYESTVLDDIEEGWRIAFGESWAQEIQEAINKLPEEERDKVYVLQLKEKFGIFIQYFSKCNEDIRKVIHKYEALSKRTCVKCGNPATRISTGWISPFCDDCKPYHNETIPIEEFFKEVE